MVDEAVDDLTDIYNELKGDKAMLVVEDILDWEDIQDMIEEGVLTKDLIIKTAKTEVKQLAPVPLETKLSIDQFKKIITRIQDDLDNILVEEDNDEESAVSGLFYYFEVQIKSLLRT